MDVIKLLKNVKNIEGYVSITEDMVKNNANLKLQFNMNSVDAIKKFQSFELQYFNKCNKTGAASIMFEQLLRVPAGKNWIHIGKELVNVIQYWLMGVSKALIIKNEHWWKFTRTLLDFIEKLYLKHQSVVWLLLVNTGEWLLDLASRTEPSYEQRYQILHCFNLYCSMIPREMRHKLKDKFDKYFIMLAAWLPRCGDLLAQLSVMVTLMRWLVPRQDARTRELAAARWLPSSLYPRQALQVFLERPWLSFHRDARSFLNAVNASGDRVVSTLIEKLSIGKLTIVNNRTKSEHWLDLNVESSCVSVIVDTSIYKALCVDSVRASDNDPLLIYERNTATVNMYSGARETMIMVKVVDPLQIFSAKILENSHEVRIYISPTTNIRKVDKTLRKIFDEKYQLLSESFSVSSQHSEESSRNIVCESDEDTRFSIPAEILQRKLLEQRAETSSSTSTTSLAKLSEKLKGFPDYVIFDKETERERIWVKPQLQTVPELTEKTSHSSLIIPDPSSTDSQNSNAQNTEKETDENANNDPSNKNLDIINQLAQEAFHYNHSNEIIGNTANVNTRPRRCDKREFNRKSTVINNFTTTDDSNSAFVENTPAVYISKTRVSNIMEKVTHTNEDKTKDSKDSGFGKQVFDNKIIEEFFSQHFAENKQGDLIVSPTLAKRINDSNSDSSSSFTLRPPEAEGRLNFNYEQVVNCLNFIVDKVCENLEKDIQILRQNSNINNNLDNIQMEDDRSQHLEKVTNEAKENKKKSTRKAKRKSSVIKLTFKNTTKQTKPLKKNNKPDLKYLDSLPVIDEKESDLDKTARSSKSKTPLMPGQKSPTREVTETPVNKKKRKLYSKKDDSLMQARTGIHVSETEEDNSVLTGCKTVNKSPISSFTPYKELEETRKKATARQLRNRKSNVVSRKTEIENNLFDRLKNTVDSEEVMLVDNKLVDRDAMYNLSSTSEDDQDFKKRKVGSRKKANSDKSKKTKRSRTKPKLASISKVNSNSEQIIGKLTRSKSKQQMDKNILPPEPITHLVDERMREATDEAFNTSLIIESREENLNIELEPVHKRPRMEIVPHDNECEIVSAPMLTKTKKRGKNTNPRAKGRKNITNQKLVITTDKADDDGKTISPLPGLEIETAQKIVEPDDSIVMLDKLNNKYEGDCNGFDLTQNLLSESGQAKISYNSKKNNNITESELIRNARSSSGSSVATIDKRLVVVLDRIDIHSPKSFRKISLPSLEKEEEFGEYKSCNRKKSKATVEVHNARPSSDISNTSVDKKLVVVDSNDMNISKSISTVGSCPITGHGDIDESPPKAKEIDRTIPRRSLEMEQFSEGVIDYYNKITNDLNVSPGCSSRKSQKELDASGSNKAMIEKSPLVFMRRLTQRQIESHLTASRNLVFDDSPTNESEVSLRKSKQEINHKSNKIRKSVISPIIMDGDMIKDRHFSCDEVRTSPTKQSEIPQSNTSIAKKRNVDSRNTTASLEVQPSASSVEDWLRTAHRTRTALSNREQGVVNEVLSGVQEKIDTTLHEIHLNTRKSLVNFLAQAKADLEREEDQRKKEMAAFVDKMLSKSKEQDDRFLNNLRTNFSCIFREDFLKTRNLLMLLREDIETAMNVTEEEDEEND